MKENPLAERLFQFSVDVILFIRKLPNSDEIRIIKYQLSKSATSTGANYEESQAASSRSDFLQKVKIA
jgi:four helix bundle protein